MLWKMFDVAKPAGGAGSFGASSALTLNAVHDANAFERIARFFFLLVVRWFVCRRLVIAFRRVRAFRSDCCAVLEM